MRKLNKMTTLRKLNKNESSWENIRDKYSEMTGIAYSRTHGGFKLSKKALDMIYKKPSVNLSCYYHPRNDPEMIKVIEKLGFEESSDRCRMGIKYINKLYIDNYHIYEYDGMEDVSSKPDTYLLNKINEILEDETISNDTMIYKINIVKETVKLCNIFEELQSFKEYDNDEKNKELMHLIDEQAKKLDILISQCGCL